MANLGTLPTPYRGKRYIRTLTVWQAGSTWRPSGVFSQKCGYVINVNPYSTGAVNSDNSGVIAGTVFSGSTPQTGITVVIFHRRSKMPVASMKTNSDGEFTINTLYKSPSEYFAVAFGPDGGDTYNALIFDRLTPA